MWVTCVSSDFLKLRVRWQLLTLLNIDFIFITTRWTVPWVSYEGQSDSIACNFLEVHLLSLFSSCFYHYYLLTRLMSYKDFCPGENIWISSWYNIQLPWSDLTEIVHAILLIESIPRQGPWGGERGLGLSRRRWGLEFLRRRKGQMFLFSFLSKDYNNNISCLRTCFTFLKIFWHILLS